MIFLPLMLIVLAFVMLPGNTPRLGKASDVSQSKVRAYVDGKPVKASVKD